MIKSCSCVHGFQDSLYGKGNRVHTEGKSGVLRCTVCGGNSLLMKMKSCANNWKLGFSMAPKYKGPVHYFT